MGMSSRLWTCRLGYGESPLLVKTEGSPELIRVGYPASLLQKRLRHILQRSYDISATEKIHI